MLVAQGARRKLNEIGSLLLKVRDILWGYERGRGMLGGIEGGFSDVVAGDVCGNHGKCKLCSLLGDVGSYEGAGWRVMTGRIHLVVGRHHAPCGYGPDLSYVYCIKP